MAKKRKLDSTSDGPLPSSPSADEKPLHPASDHAPDNPPSDEPPAEAEDELPAAAEENPPSAPDPVPMEALNPNDPIEPSAEANGSGPEAEPTRDEGVSDLTTTANPEPSPEPEPEPEEEEEGSDSLRDLLDPLSKEQLVDLVLRFASRHPDVASEAADVAGADPAHRKVFVHGLGWDTGTDALASAFSRYGDIEDCNAVRDKSTGKSKGYGFVLFRHRCSARAALREPQKKIGSRIAACQLASAGPPAASPAPAPVSAPPPASAPSPASEYTQRKIYVSNVSAEIDPQKLLQFFAKYGEIEEGPLGLDKQTGKPRGFCLFVYKAVESARKALEEPHKSFEGHTLHCQKAIDGPKWQKGGGWGQQQQHVSHSGGHYAKTGYAVGRGAAAYGAAAAASGHLMAPSQQAVVGYGQSPQPPPPPPAGAAAGINPALGQALTALLTNPNAGLGLTNLLGSLGSTGQVGGQGVPPGGSGGYGNPGPAMGGGYGGPPYGAGRGQPGGHFGGGPPYMGR